MSITLDLVRTSDQHSKPALRLSGESLGQRLYTMKFSEMLDHDSEAQQWDRMHRRAVQQAKNLPDSVAVVFYDEGRKQEDYNFCGEKEILVVGWEKIQIGAPVYQTRNLWFYDCDFGQPGKGSKHVGYVAEIRRGKGVVIDFCTEDPVALIEERVHDDLGLVLIYEDRYTKKRSYRFRFRNGKMYNYTCDDQDRLIRAVEKSYATGHWS